MSLQEAYDFESLDLSHLASNPELPEMFAALLELYRGKCQSESHHEATIQSLLDRLYGRKSEKAKYHPNQKLFFPELREGPVEEEEPVVPAEPEPKPKESKDEVKSKRKGAHGRSKLPAHLERRLVERIDMDAPSCGSCGEERPILRVESSERLNYIPAKAIVDVTEVVIRGPLPCTCDDLAPKLVRPELPLRPIDRGLPGVDLLCSIAIGKFLYHLPHYRQATKTLKDAGINLSKQTLWDWTWGTARLLEPLWELMRQKLLTLDHLGADETPTRMNDPTQPGVPTKTTYLWQYFGFDKSEAPYTVFDFAQTRAHVAPRKFLSGSALGIHSSTAGCVAQDSNVESISKGFSGTLQTDGYSAYRSLKNVTLAGCMAHARRKFNDALATSPVIASQAIAIIGKMYTVEKECADKDAEARLTQRQRESTGPLLRLRLLCEQERRRVTPQSPIGKAIGYTLNQWTELCRFVEDGHLPIDNNAVEREMKAIATGKKNWLFFGSPRGGRAAAIIYSIIASARRHKVDVWRYLGDILLRLADLSPGELEQLLPDVWKRQQEDAAPGVASDHTAPDPV